jgi:hypothetical protein
MTRSTGDRATGGRRLARIAILGATALLGLATATGVASASTSSTAAATSSHAGTLKLRGAAIAPAAASNLAYHGGPIQASPAVYLVFWGSQWSSDANGVQSYVTNFFSGLGQSNDQWSRVTSQYTGQGQHPTFTGSVLKGTWVDTASAAPSRASATAIFNEASRGRSHFGVAVSPNVNIIVLSPHGTHPDNFPNGGFCAWHDSSGGLPFTNMPYVLDAGRSCGANLVRSNLDGFSIVAGHEYLEAVTDPIPPSGWIDSSGAENADKCAWKNLHSISLSTGTFAVQPTWSNQAGGCAG